MSLLLRAWSRVVAARAQRRRLAGLALQDLLCAPGGTAPGGDAAAKARAVARAARWVPGATCLVRGAALVRWLRAEGVPARLRIGVRRDAGGLRAHAWAEVGGAPVGEDPAALAGFQPLEAPPPRAAWSP